MKMQFRRIVLTTIAGAMALCCVGMVAVYEPRLPALPAASNPVVMIDAESAPFIYKGKLLSLVCVRPVAMTTDAAQQSYLSIRDAAGRKELYRFGHGYGLASILVKNNVAYIAASRYERGNWNDVTIFTSSDLATWTKNLAIQQTRPERLFNSSICETPGRYLMAYETDDRRHGPGFSVRFATSKNLIDWKPIPGLVFGAGRYTACPMIRHYGGWTYLLVLEHPGNRYITKIYRSRDLVKWHAGKRPFLAPAAPHTNASDVDMIDYIGRAQMVYITGNQIVHEPVSRRSFPVPQQKLFESFFSAD